MTSDADTAIDLSRAVEGKRVLITGGTGSLGKVLTRMILSGQFGRPRRVTVFSRDEGKHHAMRLAFHHLSAATEDIVYKDYASLLHFKVGDVRDYLALSIALRDVDVVFNAAALKQVPSCEYFPSEAVDTNILGARNIVRAIAQHGLPVQTVMGISTDKACHPVNVMGMTKALQERVFIAGNLDAPQTRFTCARYGNVLASRGSVIPLFHEQIRQGGPVTLTHPEMTRYFLTLEDAVRTIVSALAAGNRGEIFVPKAPAATIEMLARLQIGARPIRIETTGIRPGEKIHETLVAEDEAYRTTQMRDFYVIRPALPELARAPDRPALTGAYTSNQRLMDEGELADLLARNRLRVEDAPDFEALN
jgi:UDP-glucose 4-epimerase